MSGVPPIITDPAELRRFSGGVFVPTMGGLHPGHVDLVRLASRERDRRGLPSVVVSVFVNPKQFEEQIDFDRYPREVEIDRDKVAPAGASAVFAPSVEAVYPDPDAPPPYIPPVAQRRRLEDQYRPGHLEGVCAVLWRLFELVRPAAAVFGEKDWQQLRLATQLAEVFSERHGWPLSSIGAPTVREPDGLAMSSRNRFLPPEDRKRAAAISEALRRGAGARSPKDAERLMREHLSARGLTVEYADVRDAATLTEPVGDEPKRALIAARLGEVRLIDNAPWPEGP
jgi:pantoate--beta-alanine ligase